ncbi:hypothetical protein DHW03_07275 [Pedobacter yonginense]|uniref:Uncharacterized protein n=1 Tax=Pedobacter yonginense TaxID=651869 RepID=A0A317EQ38_9SPHI|nr:hypothetical protein DHW03_07275 [Pedobacter yonginense]
MINNKVLAFLPNHRKWACLLVVFFPLNRCGTCPTYEHTRDMLLFREEADQGNGLSKEPK